LAEDLGHTTGPLFSPTSWDEIFKSHYLCFGEYLEKQGIDFWMHSDGRIHDYIDRFIEVGVKVVNPLEVKAGMDAVKLRKRYGKRLSFYGNISARAMAGSREDMEKELSRKIPLAREGGFIMHSDHSVPPQVSFERFCWMQRRAQEIFRGG
jgi:uroporphyrinogen decarboxylase